MEYAEQYIAAYAWRAGSASAPAPGIVLDGTAPFTLDMMVRGIPVESSASVLHQEGALDVRLTAKGFSFWREGFGIFPLCRRRNVSTGRVEPPVHRLRAGNGAPVRRRRARLRCAEAVQGKRVPEAVRRGSGRQGRGSSTAVVRPRVRRDGSAGSAADGLCRYPGVLLRGLAGGVLRLRMQGSCRARVRLDYRAAGRCEDARSVPFRSAVGQRVPGHLQRTGD